MNGIPLIIETTLSAPVAKVWEALTDTEQLKQWYFDMPGFKPEVGTVFEFYEPGGKNLFLHRCEVLEVIPQQKLQHTWTHPAHSKGTSILTWELKPADGFTKIRLTHEGLENLADGGPEFTRENYEEGWNEIVNRSLKAFLEK